MDLVASGLNAVVVVAVGLVLAWLGKDRFKALETRIDRLETRLDGRIDRLESDLSGRMDRIESRFETRFDRLDDRVADLRADVTQIALAVGARPRASNG